MTLTYKQIIQKAGKQIDKEVYYFNDNNEKTTISADDYVSARPKFNASLVGSLMKGIELELKVTLPDKPIYIDVTAKYGSESANNLYGPYYIKGDPEYSADDKTYTYQLYDQLLKLMVDYKPIAMTYPCTLIQYFDEFITECGLTTSVISLPNGSRFIDKDIFDGIGFTNRDVLDDIGKATATLFDIDGTEIRKVSLGTDTNKATINDDILKNCNIDFGQHFGPINTIIISRSADSDYIYKSEDNVEEADRKPYRISDCQLMNDNNRSDYIDEILETLSGIEYDIFDTELVGYGGFEPLQKVSFETGENTYYSYVFNNEIEISQGYHETIYTDMPDEAETNYKSSDTTDKRINQAFIILNKQDQTMNALVSETVPNINNRINQNEEEINKYNDYQVIEKLAQIQMDVNSINNIVKVTGGSNLIQNSLLQFGKDFWSETENGTLVTGKMSDLIGKTISERGIFLQNKKITHDFINGLIVGQEYTFTFKYTNNATFNFVLNNLDNETIVSTTESASLKEIVYTFIAKSTNIYFSIESLTDTDNSTLITDLILKKGNVRSDYESANGETLSTHLSIYYNGVEVTSDDEEIKTRMLNTGFTIVNTTNNENVLKALKDGIVTINLTVNGHISLKDKALIQVLQINNETHVDFS